MYESKIQSEEMDRLFDSILSLRNREECYRFFEDICTYSEINAMAQRLLVAAMLREKKTFSQITQLTGVSSATVTRVNRCLGYGTGGYDIVLGRVREGTLDDAQTE